MKIEFKKPSALVTVSLINVLFFTGLNLLRAISGWAQHNALEEYGAPVYYVIASGATWTLIGIVVLVLLAFQLWFTHWALASAAVIYFLWYWFDRTIMQASPNPNVVFMAIVSGLWLAITMIESLLLRNIIAKERV